MFGWLRRKNKEQKKLAAPAVRSSATVQNHGNDTINPLNPISPFWIGHSSYEDSSSLKYGSSSCDSFSSSSSDSYSSSSDSSSSCGSSD